MINNGIPIVSINGNDVVKPNQKLKDLARIKAMRNFTKLESEHVFVEDFLDDSDNYNNEFAGGGPYDTDGGALFDDGGEQNRQDKNRKENTIHFW